MAITAGMVKELREMTGAGMMDCKKALTETNGDMDAAVEVLRKSGAAKMEKKQSRIAAEGIARVAVKGNVAVVAEVNSETDFVAKNDTFQEFVQTVADTALASDLNGGANGEDVEALLGITLIGIADTNCDPDELDYVIPGNDDAIRAVKLIVSKMADAVIEAKQGTEEVAAETADETVEE